MTEDNRCPAPWCGKDREECSHVECWRRVVVTAGPRDLAPPPPDYDANKRADDQ